MRTIAIVNQKGGVGKTTSAANLGRGFQRMGKKVLLIDLDSQANLTKGLGFKNPIELGKKVMFDVLIKETDINDIIIDVEGLYLAPGSKKTGKAERWFSDEMNSQYALRDALIKLKNQFDYILLDCPPSLGVLLVMALTAANECFVPIKLDYYSLDAVQELRDTIAFVKKNYNNQIELKGVITNFYDSRLTLSKDVQEIIDKHFQKEIFKSKIRGNVNVAEAPGFGLDIFQHKSNSNGAQDFAALCEEIERMAI